ncbi:MAG: hypothetical protein JXR83_20865 [Deltaproteobacteria bacterium]|nr:hypothetical protein [Deltaproteobacteria bacterium]
MDAVEADIGRGQRLRAAAWLALIAVPPLLLVIALALQRSRIPGDGDLAAAVALVRAEKKPADQLALAPFWALRAMQWAGDLQPTFDPLLDQRPPAAERLWVIAEPEGVSAIDRLAARYPTEVRRRFGRATVACFHTARSFTFHAVERIAQARVALVSGGGSVNCDQWNADRWTCPGKPDWQHVGVEWLDVDFSPRPAVWAHPPPAGERLLIRFEKVQLTAQLEVLAGHTVHGANYGGAPVQVVVRANGTEIGRLQREPGFPLRSHRIDSSALQGMTVELEFEISTTNNGANHFVFDALISGEPAAPAAATR